MAEPVVSLPDGVRAIVLELADVTLGGLANDQIPAGLKPFAKFAPARRRTLAASPLAAALELDERFREAVADKVRLGLPDVAAAVLAEQVLPAADPLDLAAAAYLLRAPGWEVLVEQARAVELGRREELGSAARNAELARDRERTECDLVRLRSDTDRLAEERDTLRSELATALKEVRELRGRARKAEAAMVEAQAAALAGRRRAAEADTAAETERRRLQARVQVLTEGSDSVRRDSRAARGTADLRARLLLDTVVDAAQSLVRELALPPATSSPADSVPGRGAGVASMSDVSRRAAGPDDPAWLETLLGLPRVHLIVDGYNVSRGGFGELTLLQQRERLLGGLVALAGRTQAEVTAVFDGANIEAVPSTGQVRGVRVRFSAVGQSADDLIALLVRAEPVGRPVVVVSSDKEVASQAERQGARAVVSLALLRLLNRG